MPPKSLSALSLLIYFLRDLWSAYLRDSQAVGDVRAAYQAIAKDVGSPLTKATRSITPVNRVVLLTTE
jgi:hypothetical protein